MCVCVCVCVSVCVCVCLCVLCVCSYLALGDNIDLTQALTSLLQPDMWTVVMNAGLFLHCIFAYQVRYGKSTRTGGSGACIHLLRAFPCTCLPIKAYVLCSVAVCALTDQHQRVGRIGGRDAGLHDILPALLGPVLSVQP